MAYGTGDFYEETIRRAYERQFNRRPTDWAEANAEPQPPRKGDNAKIVNPGFKATPKDNPAMVRLYHDNETMKWIVAVCVHGRLHAIAGPDGKPYDVHWFAGLTSRREPPEFQSAEEVLRKFGHVRETFARLFP